MVRTLRNLCFTLVLTSGYAAADNLVIAALGDSLTQGYGLPNGEGFVPTLSEWLNENGMPVVLRNAGVSGDTTAGGLSRVDWTLTDDVDGLIVALGGNDYLRGIDPEASRANLRGIIEAAVAREVPVMLIGHAVGNNYGTAYKEAFDAMYTDLAAEFDLPLFPSFLGGLLAVASMGDGMSAFMQADNLHPNAKGVGIIVEAMGPDVLAFAQSLQ